MFGAGFGADEVTDYLTGTDALRLDDVLWTGSHGVLTEAQVVSTFGDDSSGTAILDFGVGNVITLTGVTTLAGLAGDLEIV